MAGSAKQKAEDEHPTEGEDACSVPVEPLEDAATVAADPAYASHVPVLHDEVLALLQVGEGARVIDGTLGGGGHTRSFLEQGAQVLGIDADPAALRRIHQNFAEYLQSGQLITVQAPFAQVAEIAAAHNFQPLHAILVDLGISTFQLETPARGFSFQHDGPLDMRFDPTMGTSASEIVNEWDADEIADILFQFGEERRSRHIARALVRNRPIQTTRQLAEVVERAVGGRRGSRIHPATQTFQALRIAVNQELEQLASFLPQALHLLQPGGRMGVIAFHSLEDRMVKQWMVQEASDWTQVEHHPYGGVERTPTLRVITRKPVVASAQEIERNPRSRSARLRVAEKV